MKYIGRMSSYSHYFPLRSFDIFAFLRRRHCASPEALVVHEMRFTLGQFYNKVRQPLWSRTQQWQKAASTDFFTETFTEKIPSIRAPNLDLGGFSSNAQGTTKN